MKHTYTAHGTTLTEQYYDVGRVNAQHIRRNVEKNRRKRSAAHTLRRDLLARIFTRLHTEPVFAEFYRCMMSWARGADITPMEALELLDDNTGCQTVLARYGNGIALIHTEEELEDIKLRMTDPQIMQFTIDSKQLSTLVYNNLMPGTAVFGWSDTVTIAVDALFLTEDGIYDIRKPMLANIVTWLLWRASHEGLEMEKAVSIVRTSELCIDGYVVNVLHRSAGTPGAYKITFTREDIETETIGETPGSYLRQLNIIDPAYAGKPIARWRLPYRRFYRGYWNYYKERLKTIDRDIAAYLPYTSGTVRDHRSAHDTLLREIASPSLAPHYLNEVVGAVCIAFADDTTLSVTLGLVEDSHFTETVYF